MFLKEIISYYDKFLSNKYYMFSDTPNINTPIIVTIDENGNILSDIYLDKDISKKQKTFINPYTEDSMKRSGTLTIESPNPFFDYTKIVFGLNKNNGASKWGNTIPTENGVNSIMMDILHRFNETNGTVETKSIEAFYTNKLSVSTLKDFIFANKCFDTTFILFKLITDKDIEDSELWNNKTISSSWCDYMTDKKREIVICPITGEKDFMCETAPNIKYFTSTVFTKNIKNKKYDINKFVNSDYDNKPFFCYKSQFKFSTAVNHLMNDKNHCIKNGDDGFVLFSINEDNDEDINFICSENTEKDDNDISVNELVSSVKTHCYNKDIIENNNGIYIILFSKLDHVLSVKDCVMISKGMLHDNIDFWKNNFVYNTYTQGKDIFHRHSIYSLLNNISNSVFITKMRQELIKCMISKIRISDWITEEFVRNGKQIWISNLSNKNTNNAMNLIKVNDTKILSIMNYNNSMNNTTSDNKERDILLGKIFMSLFNMESYYRFKTSSNPHINSMYQSYDMFMTTPQRAIEKFIREKSFMIDYARKHNWFSLLKFEEYSRNLGILGYGMTDKISDYAYFALGKKCMEDELKKYMDTIKTVDNDNLNDIIKP